MVMVVLVLVMVGGVGDVVCDGCGCRRYPALHNSTLGPAGSSLKWKPR